MKMVNVSFKELNAELTREELEELENAAARTIKYDEDSPEMTEEMLKQFKRMKQNSVCQKRRRDFPKHMEKAIHLFSAA